MGKNHKYEAFQLGSRQGHSFINMDFGVLTLLYEFHQQNLVLEMAASFSESHAHIKWN